MSLAAQLAGHRVLVVGDVMLDEHILGQVRRLSPEAPVPIVEIQSRRFHPGGSGNVAVNIAGLGGSAVLFGVIGSDAYGAQLRRELESRNVDARHLLAVPDRRTSTKSRVMAGSHHIVRFDDECRTRIPEPLEESLAARLREAVASVEACILSDYAKGVVTHRICETVIEAAARRGVPVVADPKGADFSKYSGATVVTPNLAEAKRAADFYEPAAPADADYERPLADVAALLLERCKAGILITRGPDGMSLFEPGRAPVHIPAQVREVYDVTGAGDTVVATLALALASGFTLADSCRLGNVAAGVVVGEMGAAAIAVEQLERAAALHLPESKWNEFSRTPKLTNGSPASERKA